MDSVQFTLSPECIRRLGLRNGQFRGPGWSKIDNTADPLLRDFLKYVIIDLLPSSAQAQALG